MVHIAMIILLIFDLALLAAILTGCLVFWLADMWKALGICTMCAVIRAYVAWLIGTGL